MRKIVPMFPWPMHPKVAEVFDGLEDFEPVEALPGGPGPVLAIRNPPPFVCDAIVVKKPERMMEAINLVTSDGIELVSMRDQLSAVFGSTVPELLEPARVRFQ